MARPRTAAARLEALSLEGLSGRERLLLHRRRCRLAHELPQRLEGRRDDRRAHLGALGEQAVEGVLGGIDLRAPHAPAWTCKSGDAVESPPAKRP